MLIFEGGIGQLILVCTNHLIIQHCKYYKYATAIEIETRLMTIACKHLIKIPFNVYHWLSGLSSAIHVSITMWPRTKSVHWLASQHTPAIWWDSTVPRRHDWLDCYLV